MSSKISRGRWGDQRQLRAVSDQVQEDVREALGALTRINSLSTTKKSEMRRRGRFSYGAEADATGSGEYSSPYAQAPLGGPILNYF